MNKVRIALFLCLTAFWTLFFWAAINIIHCITGA
jgi:hypothetical protein